MEKPSQSSDDATQQCSIEINESYSLNVTTSDTKAVIGILTSAAILLRIFFSDKQIIMFMLMIGMFPSIWLLTYLVVYLATAVDSKSHRTKSGNTIQRKKPKRRRNIKAHYQRYHARRTPVLPTILEEEI